MPAEAEGCKIGRVVVRQADDDRRARRMPITRRCGNSLTSVVLPAWVKRCGERCGETYNRLVAPITGVKYEQVDGQLIGVS